MPSILLLFFLRKLYKIVKIYLKTKLNTKLENYFLAHFEIVMRLFYRLPELLICKQCWNYFQLQFAFFRQFLLSGLRHSLPPIFYNFSSCQYKRTQIIIHIISFQNNTNCYACSTPSAPAADLMNCIKPCIY